ncbi:hypothetical protein [Lysobacter sp. Root559]|uniref:hypothetical protein n=1 Tax=Lysobacter sp. Root559 TaxID=1736559 RepID=UPI000A42D228|nr:hypothetical protein [Lysobacter sp. Root559]
MSGYRFAVVVGIVSMLAVSGCTNSADTTAVHAGELKLEIKRQDVLPSSARSKDGGPYTGRAYDTFFGDKEPRNCAEWEGSFADGVPIGDFSLYSSCGQLDSLWRYENGEWVKVRKK